MVSSFFCFHLLTEIVITFIILSSKTDLPYPDENYHCAMHALKSGACRSHSHDIVPQKASGF